MKKNRSAFALALGALFCFTVSVLCQELDFSATNIGVGNGPAQIVAVDINNDGHPGLVVANFGFRYGDAFASGGGTGATLSVLTNDGLGNLSLGATLSVGLEPASLAVGDVNGDGFADLICGNVGDNSLTVLTNDRKGSFSFSTNLPVGGVPSFVATADVNGNGSTDLICANYSDDTLTVLINDGQGNFSSGPAISVGSEPSCIATGDFNGDGKVDLVCANSGSETMEVFTNNGHGGFLKSATINVSDGVGYVVATDVNRDGSIDLVTANGVSIDTYINDGQGHFTLKFSTPATGAGMIAAADMNSDGRIDLVGPVNGNGIQGSGIVLTNDGEGKFTLNASIPIGVTDWQEFGGNYPNYAIPADFDGDGNVDFAVSCYGSAVVTALTQTNVVPRPVVTITSPANDSLISLADDIALNSTVLTSTNIKIVIYYLDANILTSTTNGSVAVQYPAKSIQPGTHSLQAAAFDSAGHVGWSPEIQINITKSQVATPPTASLTFSKTTLSVGNGPSFVLPVDLNGNGVIDLVTPNYGFAPYGCIGDYYGEDGTNLTFWMNNGSGAFTSKTTIQAGSLGPGLDPEPECVAAADFNGDGQVELVSVDFYFNTINFITNNGNGAFGFAQGHAGPARGPVFITTADVNGDGKPDIITANNFDTNLTVLTNAGGLNFVLSATLPTPSPPVWVAVADLNGDGIPDLVSANYGNCGDGNSLTVFLGNGHGGFTASAPIIVGYGPICVVAADVNGDGKMDLISANQNDNSLTVLTNDGHANFTVKSTIPISEPGCIVATNISGSGKTDLACSWTGNSYNGMVTIFINDGLGDFTTNAPISVGALKNTSYPNRIAAADFNQDGNMDLAVANYGANSLTVLTQIAARKIAPTVSMVTPTNGESFTTAEGIVVGTKTSSAATSVELLVDGVEFASSSLAPYGFTIGAGQLAAGGHVLQAVASDGQNLSGASAAVTITVNTPGTELIDFDAVNTSAGAVGGAPLANYLAGFGVSAVNVTSGTALEAVNTNSLAGSIMVEAASAPNIFTQAGGGQPESFTLMFASVLQSFGFTRAGLSSASGLVSHPAWTATAFDANGNELSSVSEGLIVGVSSVAAKAFVLAGNGIASVRFDSDSQQTAAFSGVLLDNLFLNQNAVSASLSVALSVTPDNNIVSPATLTLQGVVNDQVSGSYYVSFFAGPQLLGVSSAAPYQLTVTGVLPGQYDLQAQVTDSTGLTAQSTVIPVTVQPGPNSSLVNFDTLNAGRGPVEGQQLNGYLAAYGATLTGVSGGTVVAVESQQNISGGQAVLAASAPNVLTQLGSNGPVQFALKFSPLLSQFGFTRPELLANPFVSHPAWQVTALDGAGVVIGQAEEGEIDSSTNVGAREFSLSTTGGPGIATVVFSSQGSGLTTFNAMLLDNLVLTTNKTAFPPAVAITEPVAGQTLPAPPALAVTASAYDAAGITRVSFFAGPSLIGSATTAPYTVLWTNPVVREAAYQLKAVASNVMGLSWTSAVTRVVIASPFQITSQPASQTVAAGGSATFSAAVAGTNGVGYQWYFNGQPIAGATSSTLILPPPLTEANAGTYIVSATVNGASLSSQSAVLTVVDPPVFTTQPQGQTVTPGSTVTLRPTAPSSGAVAWQWYLNGTPIAGATSRIYTITAAQPIQSGNYQVVASSQGASASSAVAPVVVETTGTVTGNDNFANRASINPLEGPVSSSNILATVEAGEPSPGGVAGGKSIWFTWQAGFTGTISLTTAGSDFDTLLGVYTGTQLKTLKAVAADDDSGGYLTSEVTFNVVAGTDYQIQVEGYEGASGRVVLGTPAGTGYRALNPSSGSSVPVITHGPVGRTVLPNASATLTVTATSATKISYQWYFEGSPIPGATKSALTLSHVQPGAVGLYEVVAANAAGATRSEPADLEIGLTQGTAASSTENKFVDSGQAPSPKLLAQVLHPVAVGGDTRGFSVAQTFSTEGATSEPGQPEPCGQVGGASQWFVYTAPASGTMRIDTEGSTFNTLVGVYTGSGASFASLEEAGCGYTTNYLTEGQPTVVLPEAVKGTEYFILVDGYQGATGLAQLRIGLGQTLSFHSLPPSQMSVSAGGGATLNVTAIGSTPFSYQWQLNGVNIPGATKAGYTLTGAQAEAEGDYTVVVSNMMGAVTSAPPTALRVQYAPEIVTGPSNLTVKLGQPAKFSVTALGVNVKNNPFVCQWFYSNAPLTHATALIYSIPATRETNQGPYYLVISNSYGAVTSSLVTLTVTGGIQPPTVNQPNLHEPTPAEKIAAASGTYTGLFYPAGGATQASSGYLTATIASKGGGTYSANLLLDGGSYPFSGKFDDSGQTQTLVNRPGKTPVSAALQLDTDPADGRMTGQISGEEWQSDLEAGRAATNPILENPATNTYTLVIPSPGASATNETIGALTLTRLPNAITIVTATLGPDASVTRAAPTLTIKGTSIPLYAPLYSGKGTFLGWINLTPAAGQATSTPAYWLKPNSTSPTPILIQK